MNNPQPPHPQNPEPTQGNPPQGKPAWPGGDQNAQQSPNQQRPPTDNERKSGPEQDDKAHRSNLAGDQDTEEPLDTEEGKPANGHA